MSLYRFPNPGEPDAPFKEYLEDLAPLGIRWMRTLRTPVTYHLEDDKLWATIGELTYYPDTQLIKVWPCPELSEGEHFTLLGAAQKLAFEQKPSRKTCWHFRRRGNQRGYWHTEIAMEIRDDGGIGAWITAHTRKMQERRIKLELMADPGPLTDRTAR